MFNTACAPARHHIYALITAGSGWWSSDWWSMPGSNRRPPQCHPVSVPRSTLGRDCSRGLKGVQNRPKVTDSLRTRAPRAICSAAADQLRTSCGPATAAVRGSRCARPPPKPVQASRRPNGPGRDPPERRASVCGLLRWSAVGGAWIGSCFRRPGYPEARARVRSVSSSTIESSWASRSTLGVPALDCDRDGRRAGAAGHPQGNDRAAAAIAR